MSDKAERELAAFLAALPDYQRKPFEFGVSSLSQDEMLQWADWVGSRSEQFDAVQRKYLDLLQAVPAKLREYVQRERREYERIFGALLPKIPKGRRRKDDLAYQAAQLQKKAGFSYAKIAKRLNLEHGAGTATPDSVRKLLKRRKPRRSVDNPDKTQP